MADENVISQRFACTVDQKHEQNVFRPRWRFHFDYLPTQIIVKSMSNTPSTCQFSN